MIIEKVFTFDIFYPVERIGPPESTVFFDIETTGFSGDYNTVYLIGMIYTRDNQWFFVQYFAECLEMEAVILEQFFTRLTEFDTLVHFNGDTFDIPFLKKRAQNLGVDASVLDSIQSFDIFKKVKPFKKLLHMDHMRQKDIEKLLAIHREDMMSGGELISVYEHYLHTQSQAGLKLLLLHNEDDLKGMPQILPVLNIPDFWESAFTCSSVKQTASHNLFGENENEALLTFESSVSLPPTVAMHAESGLYRFVLKGNRLTVRMPLFCCEFKRFYADYKNYYYLPFEDTAIHKSIGEFIDRDARKKATAKTCYTKVSGTFFPLPEAVNDCIIKTDYSSKQCYHLLEEDFFKSEQNAQMLATSFLRLLMRSR